VPMNMGPLNMVLVSFRGVDKLKKLDK
jgi:hypothetical protein